MQPRAYALAITMTLASACSSSDPQLPTPVPTAEFATPAGLVTSSPPPASGFLDDRNCDDFGTQQEAQAFYEEAGGPDQDLHNLDPDRNRRACDEAGATPASPATAAPNAPPATSAPPAQAASSPQQHSQTSGDVDGPQGGSSSNESCETDGEERC